MQKGPQETIKLPPGAQNFLAHLAFFLMWDHCAGAAVLSFSPRPFTIFRGQPIDENIQM